MKNQNEKPNAVTPFASDELFTAFDAKIRWCEDRARDCYECRDEDCSDIGKYYDAAKAEITRFRNELFPVNDKVLAQQGETSTTPEDNE